MSNGQFFKERQALTSSRHKEIRQSVRAILTFRLLVRTRLYHSSFDDWPEPSFDPNRSTVIQESSTTTFQYLHSRSSTSLSRIALIRRPLYCAASTVGWDLNIFLLYFLCFLFQLLIVSFFHVLFYEIPIGISSLDHFYIFLSPGQFNLIVLLSTPYLRLSFGALYYSHYYKNKRTNSVRECQHYSKYHACFTSL